MNMELANRELSEILKYYGVDNLDLVFDGYEPVSPDKIIYYWHNPGTGELYAAILADYIHESVGEDDPGNICEDYWPEHECDWQVIHWFCSSDGEWFYWPECGDKCAFAKIEGDASALRGRNLKQTVLDIDKNEMFAQKNKRQELTVIDSQAHD